MLFTIEQRGSTVIVRPEGSALIGAVAAELTNSIKTVLAQQLVRHLVIDFSQVHSTDSACVASLIGAHRNTIESHCTMCLAVVPRCLMHILSTTKLDTIFTIAQTVEEAAAFKT